MKFAFSDDQRLLAETLAELLAAECSHEALAGAWESESGQLPGLWGQLAEMGVLGASVPEAQGGLGFDAVESVRSGKYMEVRLDAETQEAAGAAVSAMCDNLLANPVIEEYRFELARTA